VIYSHLFILPHYRVTARHTYRTTEVQQNGSGWHKSGKYRVTEIPSAVFTAERKEVNAEISIAVYAEMLLCCLTAVPRYR
jgi:hypothetical protein